MAKKYIRRLLSRYIHGQIAFRAHGHGNSFHIFVSKNRGRFKGRSLYEPRHPKRFPFPSFPPPPPPPPSLSRRPFSAKGWKSPKAICRGALCTLFFKLYATSGALSHHALQAQSAISCVHRTYAHRHTRGCTRGKLFLARGIRGLVAFVSSCVVARAATRLMIVSPLENYHCGSFVDLLWISGNIGFICFFFFWKKNYSLDRNVSLWRRVIVERKREREFLIEFGFFLNEVDDRKYIIFCEILKTLNNLHSNEKFFTLFP